MTNQLRLSLKYGDLSLELEGDAPTVIAQFNAIQATGLRNLVTHTPISPPSPQSPSPTPAPNLLNINTPTSETEWLLIYTHFHTLSSRTPITRQHFLDLYRQSHRYTRNRSKGLTGTINSAIKKGWLHAINDTEYALTPQGNQKLQILLS